MIGRDWPRIAAICAPDTGELGTVWMAYERDTDAVHLYDACMFRQEVLAVIAEGLNARGRRIPVAWEKKSKAIADELLKRGVNMTVDSCDDTDGMAEVVSRTIWERLRTGRFRVEKRLSEWFTEADGFDRADGKVPRAGFPLMTATRFALQMLDRGRSMEAPVSRKALYPKIAVV